MDGVCDRNYKTTLASCIPSIWTCLGTVARACNHNTDVASGRYPSIIDTQHAHCSQRRRATLKVTATLTKLASCGDANTARDDKS